MLRAQMSRIVAFAVAFVTLVVIPLATGDRSTDPNPLAEAGKPAAVR